MFYRLVRKELKLREGVLLEGLTDFVMKKRQFRKKLIGVLLKEFEIFRLYLRFLRVFSL